MAATVLLFALGYFLGTPRAIGAEKPPAAAELKVTGYGLLGNRKLKTMLELMESAGKKPELFDANFVEDAALILGCSGSNSQT